MPRDKAYEWGKTFNDEMRGITLNHQPSADKVGDLIDRLERKHGHVTPELLLEAATPRAVHRKCYNWEEGDAAHRYRLEQSRLLLRSIVTSVELPDNGPVKVGAFVSVPVEETDKRKRGYVNVRTASSNFETQDAMLQDCLNSLRVWRRKWANLAKVADALKPIDVAVRKLQTAVADEE